MHSVILVINLWLSSTNRDNVTFELNNISMAFLKVEIIKYFDLLLFFFIFFGWMKKLADLLSFNLCAFYSEDLVVWFL